LKDFFINLPDAAFPLLAILLSAISPLLAILPPVPLPPFAILPDADAAAIGNSAAVTLPLFAILLSAGVCRKDKLVLLFFCSPVLPISIKQN
jgi:hypothetical protein